MATGQRHNLLLNGDRKTRKNTRNMFGSQRLSKPREFNRSRSVDDSCQRITKPKLVYNRISLISPSLSPVDIIKPLKKSSVGRISGPKSKLGKV